MTPRADARHAPRAKSGRHSKPRSSGRLAAIPPSGTIAIGRRVCQLRAQGIDVVNLGGGVPDPAPDCLSRPFALKHELNAIGDPAGDPALRAGIAERLESDQGTAYDPLTEIAITVGAKQGLYAALLSLIDPGDEVAVLDPAWVTYAPSVAIAGGVARTVALDPTHGFALDVGTLSRVVTENTRVVVINTPHNPTGRVFTEAELSGVADICRERNLWVISDESFDKFVFDNHHHLSIAALPGMRERTVVLKSFSKAYGMIGARVGYVAGPADVIVGIIKFSEQVTSCVSPFMQALALSALAEEPDWTRRLRASYCRKRDLVVEGVRKLKGFDCRIPEGTFYVFADIRGLGMSSVEAAESILEKACVALTPGSAFGAGGEGYVRFNLAPSLDIIQDGLNRLKRAYA